VCTLEAALLAWLAGCAADASPSPGFGDATRALRRAQEASREAAPQDPGLPGSVASRIYRERYVDSLVTEPEEARSVARELGDLR
jgi:hypothetical protein